MNSQSSAASKRLAAIDIGSNSIRLLVADASADSSYRILDDEKETTRLAGGLSESGLLAKPAMERSLEALRRMKAIAEGYGVHNLQVIATSAVREASNRDKFLQMVHDRLDLKIEVISSLEEGELSFGSVAKHFDLHASDAIVVDLGGGSAELVYVAKGVVEEIHSLPIGSVRLTESLIHSDPISDEDYRRLKKHVRKCLRRAVGKSDFRPQMMIGAGGTFTALAQIAMRRRGQDYSNLGGFELNRAEVLRILNSLHDMSVSERRSVPGLHADRADIILAGLVVIERIMKLFHVNSLRIHQGGVRDGLLLQMINKAFRLKASTAEEDADPLGGIWQFATACAVDQPHAQQIAKLTRQLFDQLQPIFNLNPPDRLILEAAALLHEVGNLINYEKHHHHTYHLIMHGNLRGLTPRQRELVANVARYHRRALPKSTHANFARLKPDEQGTVRKLSAILRLADGLDRTHMQRIQTVACTPKKDRLLLTVTSAQMPDIDLWGAQQKGKFFEKLFGVSLQFCWRSSDHPRSKAKKLRKLAHSVK